MYRVNVGRLAEGLQKLAVNDNRSAPALPNTGLPTYWYWGMSGE